MAQGKKTGGRKAGVRNRMNIEMAEMILSAAEAAGSDGAGKDGLAGYMQKLAVNNPRVIGSLLCRILVLESKAEEKR